MGKETIKGGKRIEGQRGDELDCWLNISIAFIDGVGSARVGDLQRARLAVWGSDVTALKRLGVRSCQTTRVAGLVQAAQSAVACCVSSRPEAWQRGLARARDGSRCAQLERAALPCGSQVLEPGRSAEKSWQLGGVWRWQTAAAGRPV